LFTFAHCNSSYIESSWRLRGDGSLIARSLIDDITAMGGQVVCNADVEELIESDGRITEAVCKDGRRFRADAFISDIHPAVICQMVRDSKRIKKIYRRRMAVQSNTFGMFTLSLVLKEHAIPYFNHNHYVYRNADVWDFYEKKGPVSGLMVSCRVPSDAETTADGRLTSDHLWAEQIDILTPMEWAEVEPWSDTTVGHRGDDYKAFKQRKASECLQLAETVVPGITEAVDKMFTSTPLTYRDYTGTPQGSAFGMRKDADNPLMTQISTRTPVPNLFLTGQSVILHGVQGVTMTAFETTKELL
jgi:phytoene dehydrogenase-like protein